MRRNKINVLWLLMFMSFFAINLNAQFFDLYDIKADGFPTVKGYVVAKTILGREYDPPLSVDDFEVTENGNSVDATLQLKCETVTWKPPVNVVLVMDQSLSMYDNKTNNGQYRYEWAYEGARSFIDSIQLEPPTDPPSKIAILSFASTVDPYSSTDFQTRKDTLYYALDHLKRLNGPTNFNEPFVNTQNGYWGAIEMLKKQPPNVRRVIIFLTDGYHISQREFKYDEITKKCQDERIQVYLITIDSQHSSGLQEISRNTGGTQKQVTKKIDLMKIYSDIAEDIQSQNLCWLEWQSDYTCLADGRIRDVHIKFKRPTTPVERDKTYDAGEKSVAKIDVTPKNIVFGKADGGNNKFDVIIEAKVGDFTINGYNITGDNTDFNIDWNGTFPFEIKKGESRTVSVTYIKDPPDASKVFNLTFNADPCPTPAIELIAPCGTEFIEDIAFGDVPNASSKNRNILCILKNTTASRLQGDAKLTGADAGQFRIVSGGGPFDLAPAECLDMEIEFKPTTVGSKTAYIEYNIPEVCGDPITNLSGESTATDFPLSPYDWGLKRVESVNNYTYKITNTSQSPATITKIELADANPNFSITQPSLPQTLDIDAELEFVMTYTPKSEGVHSASLLVTIENISNPVRAALSGTGFLPNLQADGLTFPATKVGDASSPLNLILNNTSKWGELYIKEIRFESATNDFAWDGSPSLTELTIPTESSLSLPIIFTPQSAGLATINVEIECDAVDATVDPPLIVIPVAITGSGITLNIEPKRLDFGEVLTCAEPVLSININNPSDVEMTINNVSITQNNVVFFEDVPSNAIPAGQNGIISVTFRTDAPGTYSGTLEIETSAGTASVPLTATGTIKNYKTTFNISSTTFVPDDNTIFPIEFTANIPDIRPNTISEIAFTVNYNPKLLQFDSFSGTSISGWNRWTVTGDERNGSIMISGKGEPQQTPLQIEGSINFKGYLTNVSSDTVTINTIFEDGLDCIVPEADETITKMLVCFTEGNLIILNSQKYSLGSAKPNPASEDISIEISLGIDAYTRLELFNALGSPVRTVLDGSMNKGKYDVRIPVSELSSGVYFYTLQSGPFKATKRLIISK